MSTNAVISSIMSSQINVSFTKVNYLMSEIEDSISSVLSPDEFLPIISELLQKMQNVVSCVQQVPDDTIQSNDETELWWDSSPEFVAYSDADEYSNTVSTIDFSSDSGSSISSSSSNQAIFIDHVLTFMSKVAPDNVFSRRKSKRKKARKMRRLLHPELFSIWYYSGQIVAPSDVSKKPDLSSYPEVDWTKVNKRFLTNVPSPVQYPVHGCSEDDRFYETNYVKSDYGYMTNKGSAFTKDAPFGSLPGYRTIFGVVNVPTSQVFHGYSWLENEGWVLHATMPSDPGKKTRRIVRKKRGRKKK